jgi:hypothetical protein
VLTARLVVAVALATAGCGAVVETGPAATPGDGFTDVTVTAPPTTEAPSMTATTATTATTSPAASPAGLAAGACLFFASSQTDEVSYDVVACGEEHHAEVAGSVDVSELFPPGAEYPAQDDLEPVNELCRPVLQTYLGEDPAAYSDLAVVVLSPSRDAWEDGERTTWCAVAVTSNGSMRPYTGRLADGTAR